MMPSLVILAAGVGSRYGGLKQLDPVGPSGETIMEYSAFDAARAGFGEAVLVVRPGMEEELERTVGGRIGTLLPVRYAPQRLDDLPGGRRPPDGRRKPWGTGHAVLAAAPAVSGPFAVINADDFYGAESYASLASALRSSASRPDELYLQGFRIGPTLSDAGSVSRGLCRVDADGYLTSIIEALDVAKRDGGGSYRDEHGDARPLSGDELVSMNMWGFTPTVFGALARSFEEFLEREQDDAKAEFMLPAAVQRMIDDGVARVRVLPEAGRWCGVTYREDRPAVAAHIAGLVAQGVYPRHLWT